MLARTNQANEWHVDVTHKRHPRRVFVREERETKTAKSRQVGFMTKPLMFLKQVDKSKLLKTHP
jgi:hypothetical protein